MISSGSFDCETSFCTSCPYPGFCDEECEFCAADDGADAAIPTPSPVEHHNASPQASETMSSTEQTSPAPQPSAVECVNVYEESNRQDNACDDLITSGYSCDEHFCPSCVYTTYCDEACGYCSPEGNATTNS
eukprot:SAG31_NODE_11249_length_1050_cov_0.975815_1_plen_131_part_10